jgi:uncharacterized membrane protein
MDKMMFTLVCNFIVPFMMLYFGVKFRTIKPLTTNGLYGYRTAMSMKNEETWRFAHQYCGKLWIRLGSYLLIPSVIISTIEFVFFIDNHRSMVIIYLILLTIILMASTFPVERALKKNFDHKGVRRV